VVGPNDAAYSSRLISAIEPSSALAAQPRDNPLAADRDQLDLLGGAGFETHGAAGHDVQPLAPRGLAVELERRVHLGEVVVRADLHGLVPDLAASLGCSARTLMRSAP
jgi:hypothetical protein